MGADCGTRPPSARREACCTAPPSQGVSLWGLPASGPGPGREVRRHTSEWGTRTPACPGCGRGAWGGGGSVDPGVSSLWLVLLLCPRVPETGGFRGFPVTGVEGLLRNGDASCCLSAPGRAEGNRDLPVSARHPPRRTPSDPHTASLGSGRQAPEFHSPGRMPGGRHRGARAGRPWRLCHLPEEHALSPCHAAPGRRCFPSAPHRHPGSLRSCQGRVCRVLGREAPPRGSGEGVRWL